MNLSKIKHKLLILLMLVLMFPIFQGCSLLKIASQPFKNTISKVPESTKKAEKKTICSKNVTFDENGRILSCDGKYYDYEKSFNQEERKLTFREKISQFILNAQGYVLWFIIIAVVFFPGVFGWLIGRTFNCFRTALKSTVKAIAKAKKNGGNFMVELEKEHNQNKSTKSIINNMRTEVS